MRQKPLCWICATAACALILWVTTQPQAQTPMTSPPATWHHGDTDYTDWSRTHGPSDWQRELRSDLQAIRSVGR